MSRGVSSPSTLTAQSAVSRASQTAIDTQEAATVAIAPADADGDAANGRYVALSGEAETTITQPWATAPESALIESASNSHSA